MRIFLVIVLFLLYSERTVADTCSVNTDCNSCTNSPGNSCGWCAGTDTCMLGSADGPKSGSCTQYYWNSDTCPIQCSTITKCDKCIDSRDSVSGDRCGWCSTNNECSTSSDTCSDSSNNWYTYYSGCPTKPPTTCGNYNSSCSACVNVTGCSWCETSKFCAFLTSKNVDTCPGGNAATSSYGTCYTPCETYDNCYDCTKEPSDFSSRRCGWCAATKKCTNGDSKGPYVGTCPSSSSTTSWKWEQDDCPVYCSAKTNCSDCTSDRSLNKCGWCLSLNACIPTRPSDRSEPEGNCPSSNDGYYSNFHTDQSKCPLNCTAYNTWCDGCNSAIGRVVTDEYGYQSWESASCYWCPAANNGRGQCAFSNNVSKTNTAADQCGSYCKAHCQKYTDETSCLNYDDDFTCQWCPITGVCAPGNGACGNDQWVDYLPSGGGGCNEDGDDDCSSSGVVWWVYPLGIGGGLFCICCFCCTCRAINRSQTRQTIYSTPQPTYTTFSSKPKRKKKIVRYVEGFVDGKKTMVIQEDEVTDEE